jgi:hypothetical protein
MVRNSVAAAEALHQNHYPHASAADISEAFKAQKMCSSWEWKRLYFGRNGREMASAGERFLHGGRGRCEVRHVDGVF